MNRYENDYSCSCILICLDSIESKAVTYPTTSLHQQTLGQWKVISRIQKQWQQRKRLLQAFLATYLVSLMANKLDTQRNLLVQIRAETKHSNIMKLWSYQGLWTQSCAFECLHTYLYACALHVLIIKWHLMVVRLRVQLVFLVRRFQTCGIITRRLTTEKKPCVTFVAKNLPI